MSEKYTNELTLILKKYIPSIDKQNAIIKYQIDLLSIKPYDIYDLLIPLKSIFQINNCKNNFIECLKEIYLFQLKYSEMVGDTSKNIEIDLSAAISIPQIESYIICLFLLDNNYSNLEFRNGTLSNLTQYLFRTKNSFDINLTCFLFFFFFISSVNYIVSSGTQALASALQHNSSLLSLYLRCLLSTYLLQLIILVAQEHKQ